MHELVHLTLMDFTPAGALTVGAYAQVIVCFLFLPFLFSLLETTPASTFGVDLPEYVSWFDKTGLILLQNSII